LQPAVALFFHGHATGEAEISAQEPTVVGRFHGQAVFNFELWIERLPKLLGLCESTAIAIPKFGLPENYAIGQL
jgi:hypothetical protein